MAAGTVNQVWNSIKDKANYVWILTVTWADGNPAGSVPATVLTDAPWDSVVGAYLFALKTIPGAVASGGVVPTAYSITLVDSYGLDILNGVGASRSTILPQISVPKQDSVNALYGPVLLDGGTFTFTLAGNTNVNATGVAKFYFSVGDVS